MLRTAREITFENGNRASLVAADVEFDAAKLLADVGLEPEQKRSVVVIFGGADSLDGASLERANAVVGPGVVRGADLAGAVVIDGGTASGIMSVVGAAVARTGDGRPPLLGVAPVDLVSYPGSETAKNGAALEPNHSHFVLAPGAVWGSETQLLFQLAEALAAGGRVVAVLVGGGEIAKAEALEAVRRKWSLLVVEGTGGVADGVARRHGDAGQGSASDDPDVDAIAAAGSVRLFAGPSSTQLGRDLAWELQDEPTLKRVWRTFAGYNDIANRSRRTYSRFQVAVLVLGIGGTFLALLASARDFGAWGGDVAHWAVVAAPILLSLALALRARVREAVGAPPGRGRGDQERDLPISDSNRHLRERAPQGRARARRAARRPRERRRREAAPDGSEQRAADSVRRPVAARRCSGPASATTVSRRLNADRYLELRVGDQLSYYYPKTAQLGRRLRMLQALALVAGAVGTLLAAAGYEVWIGLTTAIAANVVAYLGYLQVEPTLVAYNQAAGRLEALRRAWDAQPPESRDFGKLVDRSEAVLSTELSGWVQQMNQAIEEAARSGAGKDEPPGGTGLRR